MVSPVDDYVSMINGLLAVPAFASHKFGANSAPFNPQLVQLYTTLMPFAPFSTSKTSIVLPTMPARIYPRSNTLLIFLPTAISLLSWRVPPPDAIFFGSLHLTKISIPSHAVLRCEGSHLQGNRAEPLFHSHQLAFSAFERAVDPISLFANNSAYARQMFVSPLSSFFSDLK